MTKKKFIKYLLEFVIIVLGITVSFWLNEFSIKNIEKQERIKVLANIETEVVEMNKYCNERMLTWKQDIKLYTIFIEEELDFKAIKEITTSKSRIEYNLIYYREFEPPMSRYNSITNSGDIKFIKSDKLKEILSRLHTLNYSSIKTTVQYEKYVKEQLIGIITSRHSAILLAVENNKISLEEFSELLHTAIQNDLELKSNLLIQMKYFETRESLLKLYTFSLEELEAELLIIKSEI